MNLKIIILNIIFLLSFTLDRVIKLFFQKTDSVTELIPKHLVLQFHENSGVLFGWWQINIIFYIIIVLLLFVLFRLLIIEYQKKDLIYITIISFILIGALSNLIDRFRFGYVIDWINVPWWSVFNLADIYIVGGVIAWFIYLFYADKKIQKK